MANPFPGVFSLQRMLPFRRWWPIVGRDTIRADALAGLVGAIVVLPQGVAFATLAGLPPEFGLYAAIVPTIVAALFGASWHAVTGPTNAVSLIVFATLSPLAQPGSPEYINLALTLAFMSGVMMLLLGLFRFGSLVNFVSHTVVVAFTAGAALLICASQLRSFFGIDIAPGSSFAKTLLEFAARWTAAQPWVVAVGAVTLAAGIAARRYVPRFPYMIAAMLAGGVFAALLNLALGEGRTDVHTLGALPAALPSPSLPEFSADAITRLMGVAIAVVVLGLTEAVSIARAIALRSGQRIDTNQEFIGQGLANIAASFFSAYPASASFNRSGLNYESGAKTPLSAVFAALFLVLILVAVAPLVGHLPLASMAAILFMVAWNLVDFAKIRAIFRASRSETGVFLVTFTATLVMNLEVAIVAGVAVSLIVFLGRTSHPAMRSLVPDPRHDERKLCEIDEGMRECPQLKIMGIEGPIYFGAVDHAEVHLETLRHLAPGQAHLLLVLRGVSLLDIAGAEVLAREARQRRRMRGGLYLCSVRAPVAHLLENGGFAAAIGEANLFRSKRDAIGAIFGALDREICARCTARIFLECRSLPPPVQ